MRMCMSCHRMWKECHFFNRSWKENNKVIPVQIDYVVAIPTKKTMEKMKIENDTIFMFELYRFDDSKKKESLKYIAPNKMIFENGLEFVVLYRCASQERCHNYIEKEIVEELGDIEGKYELIIWPIKEHFEPTDVELLHKEVLEKSLEECQDCICSNCG